MNLPSLMSCTKLPTFRADDNGAPNWLPSELGLPNEEREVYTIRPLA